MLLLLGAVVQQLSSFVINENSAAPMCGGGAYLYVCILIYLYTMTKTATATRARHGPQTAAHLHIGKCGPVKDDRKKNRTIYNNNLHEYTPYARVYFHGEKYMNKKTIFL